MHVALYILLTNFNHSVYTIRNHTNEHDSGQQTSSPAGVSSTATVTPTNGSAANNVSKANSTVQVSATATPIPFMTPRSNVSATPIGHKTAQASATAVPIPSVGAVNATASAMVSPGKSLAPKGGSTPNVHSDVVVADEEYSASPTPLSDDNKPSCFPGESVVTLKNGGRRSMQELSVGDIVQVDGSRYAPIYAFTHRDANAISKFVEIGTDSGLTLTASAGHYIMANGRATIAAKIKAGYTLRTANATITRVVRTRRVVCKGLFNPMTIGGLIVVDGIVSTTMTNALPLPFAKALLLPVEAAYKYASIDLLRDTFAKSSDSMRHLSHFVSAVSHVYTSVNPFLAFRM